METALSLALLGALVVSLAGAFALGARRVREGRQATIALAAAASAIEETEGWGFRELWRRFGRAGRSASERVDSRRDPLLAGWAERLTGLPDAHLVVELTSLSATGSAPPLVTTRAVRIRVVVVWRDGPRGRRVTLDTVRF